MKFVLLVKTVDEVFARDLVRYGLLSSLSSDLQLLLDACHSFSNGVLQFSCKFRQSDSEIKQDGLNECEAKPVDTHHVSMPGLELQAVSIVDMLIPWINNDATAAKILLQGIFLHGFRSAALEEFSELFSDFLFKVRLFTGHPNGACKIGMCLPQLLPQRLVVDSAAESVMQPGLVIAKPLQNAFPNVVDGAGCKTGKETVHQLNQLFACLLKGLDEIIALQRDVGLHWPP